MIGAGEEATEDSWPEPPSKMDRQAESDERPPSLECFSAWRDQLLKDSAQQGVPEVQGLVWTHWSDLLSTDAWGPEDLGLPWFEKESDSWLAGELARNARRERAMASRLQSMCSGGQLGGGKGGERAAAVVAVVGRAHVRPLRGLLLGQGA